MTSTFTSSTIHGWASSTSDNEVEMPAFSPFQSWSATPLVFPTNYSPTPLPLQSTPLPTARPNMHRHSHSLDTPATRPLASAHYRTSSYPNPTDRRAQRRREDDPNWVPRPPNAFIVFRCEYSRRHAQENKDSDAAPVAEKTLSKRAGEAWRKLTKRQQEKYRDRAEELRQLHADKYPNYRYKPRRRRTSSQRGVSAGVMSRREQVKSFMARSGMLESGPTYPNSGGSSIPSPEDHLLSVSSPEPPPSRGSSPSPPPRTLKRMRSYSLPNLTQLPDTQLRTYLLQPSICTPISDDDGESKSTTISRAPSYLSLPEYSPQAMHFADSLLDGGVLQYPPFDDSTAPSTPDSSLFDSYYDESYFSVSSLPSPIPSYAILPPDEPVPRVAAPVQPAEASSSSQLTSNLPALLSRRQRANTTSMLPPSPLTLVSSSLANWNGAAAASTPSLPTMPPIGSSPNQPGTATGYPAVNIPSNIVPGAQDIKDVPLPATPRSLYAPSMGVDFDRTPRCSEFPQGIQDIGLYPTTFNQLDPAYVGSSALESYAVGLDDLDIVPSSFDTSPLEDFDFSELFRVDPEP